MTLRPICLIGARIEAGHGLLLRPENRFCNGFIVKMSQMAGWGQNVPKMGRGGRTPRVARANTLYLCGKPG